MDGRVFATRPYATEAEVDARLARGTAAFAAWRRVPLQDRIAAALRWVDAVEARAAELAEEITLQMGRPRAHAGGEIAGFCDRGRTMCRLAPEALADIHPGPKPGFERFMRHEPLGLVLALAPWNYPWLCAVNVIVPAVVAGNTVLLKHSEQVPLVADRLLECARAAGLPEGVFQTVDMTNAMTARVVADPRVAFTAFTGSVEGGRAVHAAAAGTFKATNLELGGNDPAYVRADADLDHAAPNVVEGALFNAGQSCCAVERVYVHRSVFSAFVEAAVEAARAWTLGDPRDPSTALGPMVRTRNADAVRAQVAAAVAQGARCMLDPSAFPATRDDSPYLAPQILVDVHDDMDLMREETFGPVVGILPVDSDEEAIARMNASRYGLTASIWTPDRDAAVAIGERLETGTVFLNRCDVLDPELAWVGVKDSGRGVSLSRLGYMALTRPKSFHLRVAT